MTGARMPADPFAVTDAPLLRVVIEDGCRLFDALREAADRGALGPALDALSTDDRRVALFAFLLGFRLERAVEAKRPAPVHVEVLEDLIALVTAAFARNRPAARLAVRVAAVSDETVDTLIEDVLQVRR
ncbi:MAG: hypothetical protein ACR2NB_07350 [Solirubrobacteraceae bacterium]